MKLVNIHKLIIIVLFSLLGIQPSKAQVWSLQQCIDTAMLNNNNLLLSRNAAAIAAQKEKEAKANLLPKVNIQTDYRYYFNLPYQFMPLSAFGGPEGEFKSVQFGVPNVINANLQLTMPLYHPQLHGAIETAKIASELTALQYQKTEEEISFEISILYYQAQLLYHQHAFADSNIRNAEKLLQNMKLLNEQLLVRGTDVSKVLLQVAQLTNQKESIQNKYEQVLNSLKYTIGISPERTIQIDSSISYKNINDYTTSVLLDAQITKTQNRLLSTELKTLNLSRILPTLTLVGSYGTTGFGYTGPPKSFLDFYPTSFAGIQLSYPLFNGTITQRKIQQKKLEIRGTEIQYKILTEQNNMQIGNSKIHIRVAKGLVETSMKHITLAQTIYAQTILQQKQGTADLSDILLADNALRDAQQTYLSALIDYLKADLELQRLTGNIRKNK